MEEAAQHKEAYLEKARKIVDDERMKECTFKPQRVANVHLKLNKLTVDSENINIVHTASPASGGVARVE